MTKEELESAIEKAKKQSTFAVEQDEKDFVARKIAKLEKELSDLELKTIELSEKVKSKIINYIIESNFKNIQQELPKSGNSMLEVSYKLGLNEKVEKNAFVVSEVYSYYNGSLKDRKYKIYAFDINTGELMPDFEKTGGMYYGFFNDLKIVQDIL